MMATVRYISDWLRAEPVFLLALVLLCGTLPLRGQQQSDTSQQQTPQQQTQQETNQKIQQLAAIASTRPHDVPVGAGDLLHIEVFDVPELSRDVRVSDAGGHQLSADSRKNPGSRIDALPARRKNGAALS